MKIFFFFLASLIFISINSAFVLGVDLHEEKDEPFLGFSFGMHHIIDDVNHCSERTSCKEKEKGIIFFPDDSDSKMYEIEPEQEFNVLDIEYINKI